MRVHQPTYEKLVARLCGIQVRRVAFGRSSGRGVSFNNPYFDICTGFLQGFAIFFRFGSTVVFLSTIRSSENNLAALLKPTFSSFSSCALTIFP